MIDARLLQSRLGAPQDGVMGPGTLSALFAHMGAAPDRAALLGKGASAHFTAYGILDTGLRLAHWMAQAAHESGGFVYMQELGGAAYFAKYDGRADLGNTQPGDGARYHGRGVFQLTGRLNYSDYGRTLGLDLVNNPDIAAQPDVAVWIACEYWKRKGLNALADADNLTAITQKINGGQNGAADRASRLAKAKALIL